MPISELLLPEFDEEMKKTRTTLERVPADKADFAPHPKSMPLGKLAPHIAQLAQDRKSTRLNSSHLVISYAVFCLKKKSTRLNSSQLVISYAVFCLKKNKMHNVLWT